MSSEIPDVAQPRTETLVTVEKLTPRALRARSQVLENANTGYLAALVAELRRRFGATVIEGLSAVSEGLLAIHHSTGDQMRALLDSADIRISSRKQEEDPRMEELRIFTIPDIRSAEAENPETELEIVIEIPLECLTQKGRGIQNTGSLSAGLKQHTGIQEIRCRLNPGELLKVRIPTTARGAEIPQLINRVIFYLCSHLEVVSRDLKPDLLQRVRRTIGKEKKFYTEISFKSLTLKFKRAIESGDVSKFEVRLQELVGEDANVKVYVRSESISISFLGSAVVREQVQQSAEKAGIVETLEKRAVTGISSDLLTLAFRRARGDISSFEQQLAALAGEEANISIVTLENGGIRIYFAEEYVTREEIKKLAIQAGIMRSLEEESKTRIYVEIPPEHLTEIARTALQGEKLVELEERMQLAFPESGIRLGQGVLGQMVISVFQDQAATIDPLSWLQENTALLAENAGISLRPSTPQILLTALGGKVVIRIPSVPKAQNNGHDRDGILPEVVGLVRDRLGFRSIGLNLEQAPFGEWDVIFDANGDPKVLRERLEAVVFALAVPSVGLINTSRKIQLKKQVAEIFGDSDSNGNGDRAPSSKTAGNARVNPEEAERIEARKAFHALFEGI